MVLLRAEEPPAQGSNRASSLSKSVPFLLLLAKRGFQENCRQDWDTTALARGLPLVFTDTVPLTLEVLCGVLQPRTGLHLLAGRVSEEVLK